MYTKIKLSKLRISYINFYFIKLEYSTGKNEEAAFWPIECISESVIRNKMWIPGLVRKAFKKKAKSYLEFFKLGEEGKRKGKSH